MHVYHNLDVWKRSRTAALAAYQATRDALVRPLYDFTVDRPPAGAKVAAPDRRQDPIEHDACEELRRRVTSLER